MLGDATNRPNDVEDKRGMSRHYYLVAAPEEVEHQQHHHRNRLGMKAHLGLLNHHPIDLRALLDFSGRQDVIQTEEKWSELPLPCGPRHEGKLDLFTELE